MSAAEAAGSVVRRQRARQYAALMEQAAWDLLLFYGGGCRRDYFRSLIDLGSAAPHTLGALRGSGEVAVLLADPWDHERLRQARGGCEAILSVEVEAGLARLPGLTRGCTVAVAGLEWMEARLVRAIAQLCGREPQSATAEIDRLRMIKTDDEIDALARAARLADLGYRCFVETLEVGMAEFELVAEVAAFLKARGAEDNFMRLSSGGPEARAMTPPTERRFRPGDLVATEITPQVEGCFAQLCRTLVVGDPTPAQCDAFALFARAQAAAERLLGPGVNIRDVARVQDDVFRAAGFGEYTGREYTRLRGHGLGLFVDEPPSILEEVDCLVSEGMVLIPHPNTYLPTTGYMVLGDTLVVTASGCEPLGSTEKKLFSTPS